MEGLLVRATISRGSWPTQPVSAILIVSAVAIVGCPPDDTRITYQEYQQRASGIEEEKTPVGVNTQQLPLSEIKPYQLGSGDVINLTMVGLQDEFSQTDLRVRVTADGLIHLPLAGSVNVRGKNLQEAEKAIFDAYVPRFTKSLSVYAELSGPEGTTVIVVGAAGEPGLVKLRSNERNPLYAVEQAGGFFRGASGRIIVKPIRSPENVASYNLLDIDDITRIMNAPPLMSGDMVTIEEADANIVYVTGLVNTPIPVAVPHQGKISVARAIAAAGGLRDFLDPPEATLWRRMENGEQVRVKLELAALMNGETEDILLAAGDILDIPHTPETRFREWFANNIVFGPFGMTAVYDPVSDFRARILADDNNNNIFRQSVISSLGSNLTNLVIPTVVP